MFFLNEVFFSIAVFTILRIYCLIFRYLCIYVLPGHGTFADANIRVVRTAKRLAMEINA
jgi:hypothetical protein